MGGKMGTDLESVPIFREREVNLKRRTAAGVSSAAVLLYGGLGLSAQAGEQGA